MPSQEHGTELVSFMDRDRRLWSPLQRAVEGQIALDLLGRYVADCSTRLDEQAGGNADPALLALLAEERNQARRLRRELDVTDPAAVREVLLKYGQLVRDRRG